jgi:hypothetical protein
VKQKSKKHYNASYRAQKKVDRYGSYQKLDRIFIASKIIPPI